jgi:hypothetical protein
MGQVVVQLWNKVLFFYGTPVSLPFVGRAQLKCDGTRWRTGGEVKGKQENEVGNQ